MGLAAQEEGHLPSVAKPHRDFSITYVEQMPFCMVIEKQY
jgi:hypothetical protein